MLNRVSEKDSRPRQRLTQDERRRQLLGIGLKMLTERPIQDVALDAVAEEAGISRGLLFHYFPSKTAYYEAVVAAAGRRILRNVTPPDDVTGRAALAAMVEAFVAQIERRHELYRALVEGSLADVGGAEVAVTLRERLTGIVLDSLATEPDSTTPHPAVVHAWLEYVEDLAVQGTRPAVREQFDAGATVRHALAALDALSGVAITPSHFSPQDDGAPRHDCGPDVPKPVTPHDHTSQTPTKE